MKYEKIRDLCAQQEALLRFESFDQETAWELGCRMVAEMKRRELKVCAAVWSLTGYVLFQYAGEGTTLNNQNWICLLYTSKSSRCIPQWCGQQQICRT